MGLRNGICGGITGAVLGGVAGAGVAVLGGYEIGTALNNYLELQGTFGRGLVDLVVIGVAAGPTISVGYVCGGAIGMGVGSLFNKTYISKREEENLLSINPRRRTSINDKLNDKTNNPE